MSKDIGRTRIMIVLLLTAVAAAQEWDRVVPSLQNRDLRAIAFTENGSGWAVGDGGALVYSADNGATWSLRQSGTSAMLLSVFFLDNQRGWLSGGIVSGGG